MNQVDLANIRVKLDTIRQAIKLEYDRATYDYKKMSKNDTITKMHNNHRDSLMRVLTTLEIVQESITKNVLMRKQ